MIVIEENTVAWNLLHMIALCGEFPAYSVGILGNRREYRKRICQMQDMQKYKNPYTGQTMTVKALTVSSAGRTKTVRILKNAVGLLKWTGDYKKYADRFLDARFHGDEEHLDRNHRVAETAALFFRTGYQVETFSDVDMTQMKRAVFYLPHVFKSNDDEPNPKASFTRITGAFGTPESCFAVYNTRDKAMNWAGRGETKSMLLLSERFGRALNGAILLGKDYEVGMKAALNTESADSKSPFCRMFNKLFFVPLDENGIKLLPLIAKKDFSERILELTFDPADRSYQKGSFNYHAKVGNVYVYSFLDSDLRGLVEFRNGIHPEDHTEILCYDFQTGFIQEFFRGTGIKITVIPFDAVKDNLS